MKTVTSKAGRSFYVEKRENIIYVGTNAQFSTIAAQMIVHEAMRKTGLNAAGVWNNIITDDGTCLLGVGYKLPIAFKKKALNRVDEALRSYEYKYEEPVFATDL